MHRDRATTHIIMSEHARAADRNRVLCLRWRSRYMIELPENTDIQKGILSPRSYVECVWFTSVWRHIIIQRARPPNHTHSPQTEHSIAITILNFDPAKGLRAWLRGCYICDSARMADQYHYSSNRASSIGHTGCSILYTRIFDGERTHVRLAHAIIHFSPSAYIYLLFYRI